MRGNHPAYAATQAVGVAYRPMDKPICSLININTLWKLQVVTAVNRDRLWSWLLMFQVHSALSPTTIKFFQFSETKSLMFCLHLLFLPIWSCLWFVSEFISASLSEAASDTFQRTIIYDFGKRAVRSYMYISCSLCRDRAVRSHMYISCSLCRELALPNTVRLWCVGSNTNILF